MQRKGTVCEAQVLKTGQQFALVVPHLRLACPHSSRRYAVGARAGRRNDNPKLLGLVSLLQLDQSPNALPVTKVVRIASLRALVTGLPTGSLLSLRYLSLFCCLTAATAVQERGHGSAGHKEDSISPLRIDTAMPAWWNW